MFVYVKKREENEENLRGCQLQVETDGRHHSCQSKQVFARASSSSSWSFVDCYSVELLQLCAMSTHENVYRQRAS